MKSNSFKEFLESVTHAEGRFGKGTGTPQKKDGEVLSMKKHLHKKMDAEFDKQDRYIEQAKDRVDDAVDSAIQHLGNVMNRQEAQDIVIDHLSEIVMYFDLEKKK